MKATIVTTITALMAATAIQAQGLKDAIGHDMLIGVAVNEQQASDKATATKAIIRKHFNSIVAENCMKSECLQPKEGLFCFNTADSLVSFAHNNGQVVIGHCLVWHSQAPKWFFTDDKGQAASRKVLTRRIKRHIKKTVSHYKGKIHGWDVVNEAFEDDGSFRKSPLYNIIGEDFIEIAFRAAHEADPNAELYYNDYSLANPAKRNAVCRLVRKLKNKGVRIDAIGMQSHNGLNYPSLADYEASIDSFAACGVKVMITELDLNILPNPDGFGGADIEQDFKYDNKLDPYTKGLPDSVYRQFEQRYLELFNIYSRHRNKISRINIWGISDQDSWLNDFPIQGRTNYPLLFDRQYHEKPIINKIINLWNTNKKLNTK